ncbi:WXG100 family type VII secretion target [Lentibacillus sp. N15]|uniref:WXG100 family type VII secretion target n=1 Tax=Lentibacillus songyuanensis TaxID=3136161 RepID=UPI0031BAE906
MAGQIKMTPDELQGQAKRYGEGADQIQDVLSKLESLQSELSGQWSGRAFERFDEQFAQLRPKVQDFEQLMRDIQLQLEKTADAVAQQDEALAQNFGLR